MSKEKNKNRPSFAPASAEATAGKKASEGEKNKDDCPLCQISPETIAALKKAKKAEEKKKDNKF